MTDIPDVLPLPKGPDRIAALRQAYVSSTVLGKGPNALSEEKSERLKKAEAFFVGEAFDGLAHTIEASRLDEDEKIYLWEQLMAFPPSYAIYDVNVVNVETNRWELATRQAEIRVDPALRAATRGDLNLLHGVLLADSYARAMSPELVGSESGLRINGGTLILIHTLIRNASGINREKINWNKDPITIASAVDTTDFASEEKAALRKASTAYKAGGEEVEVARKIPEGPLHTLGTATEAYKKGSEAFLEAQKLEALRAIEACKSGLPSVIAGQPNFMLDALDQLAFVVQGDRDRMEWESERHGHGDRTLQKPQIMASSGFREAIDRFLLYLRPKERVEVTDPRRVLVDTLDRMHAALTAKERVMANAAILSEEIEQLSLIIKGDRKNMYWTDFDGNKVGESSKPLISTINGFHEAADKSIAKVTSFQDRIPEVGPAIAAIGEFVVKLEALSAANARLGNASSVCHEKVEQLRKERYIAAMKAASERASQRSPSFLQGLQLLREIHHASLGSGAIAAYEDEDAFLFDPDTTGNCYFKMTDFGHIDSRGDLQVGGVSPKVAADLRATLVAHLNDFDFESGRAPLSTDEVVAAARGAISDASQRAQKAEAGLGSLREDYAELGSQAIDLEDHKRGLMAELSEVRGALETVRKETAAASEEIAKLRGENAGLLQRARRECYLAEAADSRVTGILEAVKTLRAALAAANEHTFSRQRMRARALAWTEFDRINAAWEEEHERVKKASDEMAPPSRESTK